MAAVDFGLVYRGEGDPFCGHALCPLFPAQEFLATLKRLHVSPVVPLPKAVINPFHLLDLVSPDTTRGHDLHSDALALAN